MEGYFVHSNEEKIDDNFKPNPFFVLSYIYMERV